MENESIKTAEFLVELVKTYSAYSATVEAANKTLYAAMFTAGASIIGAFFTIYFNLKGKKIDYKRDYYKKIIDKRMESYEKLNDVINSILVVREVLSKNCVKQGYSVCELFIDVKNIDDILDKIVDIRRYSIWFTEEIVEKISYINLILSNVSLALNHPSDEILAKYNLSVKDIGVKKCSILIGKFESEKLCQLAEEIKLIIANDLLEMHNVEDFLSNKVNEGE